MPILRKGLELILPPATQRWVGLLVDEPDLAAGTYSEITDSAYARQAHSGWTWSGTDLWVANNALVIFPAIADAPVTVVWWGIFDALAAGNLLAAGPLLKGAELLPTPFDLGPGDQAAFLSGDLRLKAEG